VNFWGALVTVVAAFILALIIQRMGRKTREENRLTAQAVQGAMQHLVKARKDLEHSTANIREKVSKDLGGPHSK
jgi:hypothetical protein